MQPETLKSNHSDIAKKTQAEEAINLLSKIEFDAMVVVAYGLILPQEILDIAQQPGRHGSFNIHASLLPRWRGAAPIQRAIEAGDAKTGVCIMQMDAGLDTGDTVLIEELEIGPEETSTSLHDRLSVLGAKRIVDVLRILEEGAALVKTPQPTSGINYAEKILKIEAEIDWRLGANQIDCQIRAFNPFPGAVSMLAGNAIKFWNSRVPNKEACVETGSAGEVLGFSKDGVYIQCGLGVIEVLEIQKPGGKKMSAKTCIQSIGLDEKLLHFLAKE